MKKYKDVIDHEYSEYYSIFNDGETDIKVHIHKNGRLPYWPKGFLDLYDLQLTSLCGWDE
jgi:hypothetical protein